MSAYGQLTLGQLRLFVRNRQVLFWTLGFPIFFMVMLGSFLGSGGGLSVSGAYIDLDRTEASSAFVETMLSQTAMITADMEEAEDREDALAKLEAGDYSLVVIIPEGYAAALAAEEPAAQIDLYYDQTNVAVSGIGQMFVSSVVDAVSKEQVGYIPAVTLEQHGVKAVEDLPYINFLVPGIVAMMIMSNNLNGVAGQIASWRERGVLRRMQGTPLRPGTFIAAQITARLILNGLQAMIVLLVGHLFFGTEMKGSWLLLIFFVVLGTLAFMAIGFIIAGVAKTPESVGPIAGFISFPLLFLGGVFFPISNMPEFLQPVVRLLPISHLSTSLREVMNTGAGLIDLWYDASLLGGWMLVAFLIASRTFKWE